MRAVVSESSELVMSMVAEYLPTMTGGIPFHVIGRKYTEGTNSRPHACVQHSKCTVHRG